MLWSHRSTVHALRRLRIFSWTQCCHQQTNQAGSQVASLERILVHLSSSRDALCNLWYHDTHWFPCAEIQRHAALRSRNKPFGGLLPLAVPASYLEETRLSCGVRMSLVEFTCLCLDGLKFYRYIGEYQLSETNLFVIKLNKSTLLNRDFIREGFWGFGDWLSDS